MCLLLLNSIRYGTSNEGEYEWHGACFDYSTVVQGRRDRMTTVETRRNETKRRGSLSRHRCRSSNSKPKTVGVSSRGRYRNLGNQPCFGLEALMISNTAILIKQLSTPCF